jgi:DNA-binding transcriptional LysR family regulator
MILSQIISSKRTYKKMLHVSLRQLEYVVGVAKAGGLSAASEQMGVSQPALSVAISQVEKRVGEALFIRRKGVAVVPTAFGRLFLRDAEALLADAERLEQPGALTRRTQDRVTLGILDELAPSWLAPIIVKIRSLFPETVFQAIPISFETLANALLTGKIDLGLTYDLGLDAMFERDLMVRVSPWAWISPGDELAKRRDVSLREIANRPLILSDQSLSVRHMLGLFKPLGVTPLVKHRAASIELLRSLAANGEGTGLSYTNPPGLLTYDNQPVVRVQISDPDAIEPIVLAHLGSQPEPIASMRQAILKLAERRSS